MLLRDLTIILDQIAPLRYAEPWDNVGLLIGNPAHSITRILLTIDYTPTVAAEALANQCNCVIAYHPPIFDPIKRLTAAGKTAPVFQAIQHGIALYSPHTALDVVTNGTNDVLADAVGLTDRRPLQLWRAPASNYKLVIFVPAANVSQVSQAIFTAGAGHIGQYSSCSFQSEGTGTFFGEPGSNPTVGSAGKLEHVPEIRLETIVPIDRVPQVIQALRNSHPYEEPAFDLQTLAAQPTAMGLGRIGDLPQPTSVSTLIQRIKQQLNLRHVLTAGPTDRTIQRPAVAAGSGKSLLADAIEQKADLFLTGELAHHDALLAAAANVTVICTLHSNSERPALKRLKETLEKHDPNLAVLLSQADRDPFEIS